MMARMSWHEACLLDPSLHSISRFFTRTIDCGNVDWGLTNRCWKIVHPDHPPVVWRPITSVTKIFAISRHQEYQILSALDRCEEKLSPKPYCINDHGLLVAWIEGDHPTVLDPKMLIHLLGRIHRFPVQKLPIFPFSYTARIDHYWFQLKSLSVPVKEIEPLYQYWRTQPDIAIISPVLCHFDLGRHNVIKTISGLQVIDWEYATIGDPRIDLAMSIQGSGGNLATMVGLYCQMQNITALDEWIDAVKRWIPRVMMMSMLWYLIADQV
ncbi:phosphotransferase [Vibrio sp. PP-XX7]